MLSSLRPYKTSDPESVRQLETKQRYSLETCFAGSYQRYVFVRIRRVLYAVLDLVLLPYRESVNQLPDLEGLHNFVTLGERIVARSIRRSDRGPDKPIRAIEPVDQLSYRHFVGIYLVSTERFFFGFRPGSICRIVGSARRIKMHDRLAVQKSRHQDALHQIKECASLTIAVLHELSVQFRFG